MTVLLMLSILSALIWLFLLVGWGGFWRCDQRLDPGDLDLDLDVWPSVCAIIPARDEADSIGQTVHSLLSQGYPGLFRVVLVDDQSSDGTANVARQAAVDLGQGDRLTVLTTPALPAGWSGKLWAVHTGTTHVLKQGTTPDYLLLTDADIVHPQDNLKTLISKAVQDHRVLVSLMVRLRCQSLWEKALIPAFIFFFQQLYPFPWANSPNRKLAAAAGGCILVEKKAFMAAGGIPAIKDALIDDCALAAAIKRSSSHEHKWGRIWLGLSGQTRSLRAYSSLESVWTMVARTAFTQLRYSNLLLLGAVLGMTLVYLWPPLGLAAGLILGQFPTAIAAGVAWFLMAIAYGPTIWFYRLNPLWSLILPLVALLYTLMTIDSAVQHWQGKGGAWKGRIYPAQ